MTRRNLSNAVADLLIALGRYAIACGTVIRFKNAMAMMQAYQRARAEADIEEAN